ncbi:MAG TPA: NAD(P)/FAD-dependent oxidoreductase [Bacteroidia bacterium]|nr:NAD(P)/FAD-dependent oxidoreductase [Bacteroidia bacterium]
MIVIGGGAAGFFAAINLAMRKPEWQIQIVEKSGKLLSKVRVSGGGRCNVTHACFDPAELVQNYPRGKKELRQVFSRFGPADTIAWFKAQGIVLKTERDGRMFPVSNSSESIISCFLDLASRMHIQVSTGVDVKSIEKSQEGFVLQCKNQSLKADLIIAASGGNSKPEFYALFRKLGHTIVQPSPSLFTFNLPGEEICQRLQGISVQNAEVKLKNTSLRFNGPVLITHWGLSGPAVLKLSAFAARELHDMHYEGCVVVNWLFALKVPEIDARLRQWQEEKRKSLPFTQVPFDIPKRLWEFLCVKAGIHNDRTWAEIPKKNLLSLAHFLGASEFQMSGRSVFKEEFVTAGGISLKEVDFTSMQSKVVPGLYFCGEVLDIDGITGGFNFQNAWSTAWIAAMNCGT